MSWITFDEILPSASGKTRNWNVVVTDNPAMSLGTISWHGPWRKYCFYPHPNCVFEQDCLRDIARFIEEKTKEHRNAAKSAKVA